MLAEMMTCEAEAEDEDKMLDRIIGAVEQL